MARSRQLLIRCVAALLAAAAPGSAQSPFDGDTYSVEHRLTAASLSQCFSPHLSVSGEMDNEVIFDGDPEVLWVYADNTVPRARESYDREISGPPVLLISTEGFLPLPGEPDLFPSGFQGPGMTLLTDDCYEIGRTETLDSSEPVHVIFGTIEYLRDASFVLPPSSLGEEFFTSPWDGRLTLTTSAFAGAGIDEVNLRLELEGQMIFTDGFESGDLSAWSSTLP